MGREGCGSMTASDAVVVFGLFGAMVLTSLAAGLVAGGICSIRRRNRAGVDAGEAKPGADTRAERPRRVTIPSASSPGTTRDPAW